MSRLAGLLLLLIASLQSVSFAQTKSPSAPSSPPSSGGQLPPPQVRIGNPVIIAPPVRSPLEDMMLRNPGLFNTAKKSPIGHGVLYAPEANVPKEPLREFRQGFKALSKKDLKSAEQHLERATELYPRFSSAFNLLGVAYEFDPEKRDKNSGVNESAKAAFREAIRLNPSNHEALTNLGYLLLREKDPKQAEQMLRLAVAIQPESSRAVAELMLVHAVQKHFDDVITASKHLRPQAEREFPIVLFLRGVAWEYKSEHEKAVSDYREYLKSSPDTREALLARAALQRLKQ